VSAPPDWPLGLAWLAQVLGRDLQRAARRAGGPAVLWGAGGEAFGRALGAEGAALEAALAARARFDAPARRRGLGEAAIAHLDASDPRWPRRLDELHDPPFGLFARGAVEPVAAALAAAPVVAIVGSRRATAQGRAFARALAARLAGRGALVVSGLAHGIDASAHEGALDGGGLTAAVLGSGVDVPYPRRNRRLAARIAEGGALLSEYWPGTAPAPWRFPARNRIVAGLAHAVVVVEAGRRSGALITADFALELGRPVLAVPGWPGALASEGCNALLRAGAALVEGPDDVVAELPDAGWSEAAAGAGAVLEGLGGRIHSLLQREPMGADRLAEELGEEASAVSAALALLEVEGLAVRGEARRFWAAPLRGVP
jgi:DNA processing protein